MIHQTTTSQSAKLLAAIGEYEMGINCDIIMAASPEQLYTYFTSRVIATSGEAQAITGTFPFRSFAMKKNYRRNLYWKKLIETHGSLCFYCQLEPAATVDHVIPISYGGKNEFDNVVPSCWHCNLIASDSVFGDIWEKRQYILNRRKKKLTHAICTECLLPFIYRRHSPSLFLCAICYDLEYGTNKQNTKSWREWVDLLRESGVPIELYQQAAVEIRLISEGPKRNKFAYVILHKYFANDGMYENVDGDDYQIPVYLG